MGNESVGNHNMGNGSVWIAACQREHVDRAVGMGAVGTGAVWMGAFGTGAVGMGAVGEGGPWGHGDGGNFLFYLFQNNFTSLKIFLIGMKAWA